MSASYTKRHPMHGSSDAKPRSATCWMRWKRIGSDALVVFGLANGLVTRMSLSLARYDFCVRPILRSFGWDGGRGWLPRLRSVRRLNHLVASFSVSIRRSGSSVSQALPPSFQRVTLPTRHGGNVLPKPTLWLVSWSAPTAKRLTLSLGSCAGTRAPKLPVEILSCLIQPMTTFPTIRRPSCSTSKTPSARSF